jgi:heme/copper-type cytochrome/quinol oxidase subunit 2
MAAPMTSRQPSFQPQSGQLHNQRYVLLPIAIMGFMIVLAAILIYKVIVSAPDTHSNLWNEAREGYSRTEVAFIGPISTPTPSPTGEIGFLLTDPYNSFTKDSSETSYQLEVKSIEIQTFNLIMGEGETVAEVNGDEEIVAEFHRWEPGVMVVNKGDTVDLTVTNPRGNAHSFILPDFGVATPVLEARGGTTKDSFVADKAGVFQYACGLPYDPEAGYCDPDHQLMVGYLIVLE